MNEDDDGLISEPLPGLDPPAALDELVQVRVNAVLRARAEPQRSPEALPQPSVPPGERWVLGVSLAVYGGQALIVVWRLLVRAL